MTADDNDGRCLRQVKRRLTFSRERSTTLALKSEESFRLVTCRATHSNMYVNASKNLCALHYSA